MSSPETSIAADPVVQFSVFVDSRVGRLHDLYSLLLGSNVHTVAFTVVDTTDSAVVRLVLDDPEKTRKLLHDAGYPWIESEILAVEMPEESLDVQGVLTALLEAEVNIHYLYVFLHRPQGRPALVLHVEDREVATQALQQRRYRVLSQHDISR